MAETKPVSFPQSEESQQKLAYEVSRLKAVEAALRAEQDFLSKALDGMDVLVIVLDRKGNIVRFNRACERLFGYTAYEIRSKLTTGMLPLPKEIGAIKQLLYDFRKGGETKQYESQWKTHAGDLRTIAWNITFSVNEKEEVEYVFASGIDITSRIRAENLLERERVLLRGLINSIPDLIFYKDLDSVYLGCNGAFEAFRDSTAQAIIGKTDASFYDPALAEEFLRTDRLVLSTGQSLSYESWTTDPSGEQTLFETRKTPFYSPDGEIMGVIGIGRDITKHRMVENALRLAKSEIEQLISSLSSVLIVLSQDYTVTHWNLMAQKVFGIPKEQILSKPLTQASIHWDLDTIVESLERCNQERKPVFLDPMCFKRPNGDEGFLGISISPIRDHEESVSGFILLCGDITERKILESRLAQAQKLESIGQLAAGIAYEISTPIQHIGNNTDFLQESFRDLTGLLKQYGELLTSAKAGTISAEMIEQVEAAAEKADVAYLIEEIPLAIQQSQEGIHRVSEIVRAMKEFSHPGVREKKLLDINKAIESTLAVTRNEYKYVAQVETDLDPDLPKVLCLPGEINQVFLNIIVNAAQAIEAKMSDGNQQKGLIAVHTRSEGEWVEIRISDTGTGIPKEVQSHVFEPFFTTKEVGKGTGQGLAIAYDVIERKHSGRLAFETMLGEGTTFIIRLPLEA